MKGRGNWGGEGGLAGRPGWNEFLAVTTAKRKQNKKSESGAVEPMCNHPLSELNFLFYRGIDKKFIMRPSCCSLSYVYIFLNLLCHSLFSLTPLLKSFEFGRISVILFLLRMIFGFTFYFKFVEPGI